MIEVMITPINVMASSATMAITGCLSNEKTTAKSPLSTPVIISPLLITCPVA